MMSMQDIDIKEEWKDKININKEQWISFLQMIQL